MASVPTSQSGTARSRFPAKAVLLLAGVPALGFGVWSLWDRYGTSLSGSEENSAFVTEVARRAPLRVTVTERGQLDSESNVSLASSVEGTSTIISIVEEGFRASTPVLSEVEGEVTAIEDSSEGGKEIVVVGTEGDAVTHLVSIGSATRIRVEAGDKVAEGDMLAGDLLCELDSSTIREEYKEQVIKFKQAEADLVKSRANVDIQQKQNESDLAAARLAKTIAELDRKKFEKGESLQQKNEVKGEMTLAEEELTRAREIYDFTKRLARKGYKSLNDLEADRIAVTKAEIAVSVANDKLMVLEDYTYERTMAELIETEAEAGRALERTTVAGDAALEGYKAELEARELAYEVEETKLNRLKQQLDACMLFAPQDGVVVYANQGGGRRGSSDQVVIEEGATVRERQKIINLPDLGRMKVDTNIHESRITLLDKSSAFAELDTDGSGTLTASEVQDWMWPCLQRVDDDGDGEIAADEFEFPATLRIDAFPGERFTGIVGSVASVASSGDWMRPDLKQYAASIVVVDFRGQQLKPGMNAVVEVVVKQREDVLQIPVQAVVAIGGKRYCWVLDGRDPVRREVEVGDASGTSIEVRSGVEDGERVIMNPRTQFGSEIEELQAASGDGGGGKKGKGKGKGGPGGKGPGGEKGSKGDKG